MRQSEGRRVRNKAIKSDLKTEIKKYESTVASGERESAEQAFKSVSRTLDKAASKGVIHKNKAANKKSRLSKSLKTVTGRPTR